METPSLVRPPAAPQLTSLPPAQRGNKPPDCAAAGRWRAAQIHFGRFSPSRRAERNVRLMRESPAGRANSALHSGQRLWLSMTLLCSRSMEQLS